MRYPLFDTEELTNGLTAIRQFFVDHTNFVSGTAKTEADTNMTLDSILGTPKLYDFVGLTGEFWRDQPVGNLLTTADFSNFYTRAVLRWIFGQDTFFLRTRISRIPEGVTVEGFDSAGRTIHQGVGVVKNFYNFTTPDRRARRIGSTEQFRAEIAQPLGALTLTATRRYTLYMLGILYSSL